MSSDGHLTTATEIEIETATPTAPENLRKRVNASKPAKTTTPMTAPTTATAVTRVPAPVMRVPAPVAAKVLAPAKAPAALSPAPYRADPSFAVATSPRQNANRASTQAPMAAERRHPGRSGSRRNACSPGPTWPDTAHITTIIAIGYNNTSSMQRSNAGAVHSGVGPCSPKARGNSVRSAIPESPKKSIDRVERHCQAPSVGLRR